MYAVGCICSETEAVIVSLDAFVPFAGFATVARLNEWEQSAGRIGTLYVGIHGHNKLMMGRLRPNTIERFAVLRVCFASNGVRDFCLRHQIAFIGSIDK